MFLYFKQDFYVTAVMPVALPQGVRQRMKKDVWFVDHVPGPEVCSFSTKIQGLKGRYADLNGKTVTVKVNGQNAFTPRFCSDLKKKGGFNPAGFKLFV